VRPLLQKALAVEHEQEGSGLVFGFAALGALRAAELLSRTYTLVVTNAPYLGSGKQAGTLKAYLERYFSEGKADLATAFLQRCFEFCDPDGSVGLVLPQNSLFLKSFSALRKQLLTTRRLDFVARLGSNAFRDMNWWAAITMLFISSRSQPSDAHEFVGLDVGDRKDQIEKASLLQSRALRRASQAAQLENSGHAITFVDLSRSRLLADYAQSVEGLSTGDADRFLRQHWELNRLNERSDWDYFQVTARETTEFDGCSEVIYWQGGEGELERSRAARIQGQTAWGREGVLVSKMNLLKATRYFGIKHDKMSAALIPDDPVDLAPLWARCSSPEYHALVREVSQKVDVATATLLQVPFDRERWQRVAAEGYPGGGLPMPETNDPTQWLFHGRPEYSPSPLLVAAARLVGYEWPAELDQELHLSSRARELAQRSTFTREDVELLVRGLVLSGLAMILAGTSRPCSGSEHLLSHAFDEIGAGHGTHGEQVAVGCRLASLFYDDTSEIAAVGELLDAVGAPASPRDIGISKDDASRALQLAPTVRPGRLTRLTRALEVDPAYVEHLADLAWW
jgi:Iron-containing alcohol dehydrogenase/N-6 DNA Methylase